jgi:membrane protease YdiL (CAAX protease family)
VNLGAGLFAVWVVHRLGVSWRDLGLARDRMRAGLRLGLWWSLPIVCVVAIGVALPLSRPLFLDLSVLRLDLNSALFEGLLRIPLGTALAEELLFRGALLGLYLRRHRPLVAVAMASVVFGLWHVLPTLGTLGSNQVAADVTGGHLALRIAGVCAVVVGTGTVGAWFCWLRLRSGSIVAPWLAHAAINMSAFGGARLAGWLSGR